MRPGFAAVVLADGAGSARLAELGAQVAVTAVATRLRVTWPRLMRLSDAELRTALFSTALRALETVARRRRCALTDLASTLLLCFTDGTTLVAAQIGDGRIGVRERSSGEWRSVFEPTKGEFANETVFVTSESAFSLLQLGRMRMAEFDGCVLMSDGSEESLFNRSSETFSLAVETMFRWGHVASVGSVEHALAANLRELLRQRTLDDVSIGFLVDTRLGH